MVIDTSALVAILLDEPDRRRFTQAIARAPIRVLSAATLVEAGIVIEARLGEPGGRELDLLLHRADVEVLAVDDGQAALARSAWRRFGKGRHPAALNYGDCFSYALAALRDEPLLFKGDDFAATDIRSALT
ncbi:MAG: type II toxin-antitoxin system VapC family toxin [Solirubrobacteraceae bacterium]|nr:type II toxin-antitoxin system VapC family toxin [Solirubrobacteraceae bacterium]